MVISDSPDLINCGFTLARLLLLTFFVSLHLRQENITSIDSKMYFKRKKKPLKNKIRHTLG